MPTEAKQGDARGALFRSLAVLAVILCALAAVKLRFDPGVSRSGLDGGYYFQIARHVSEGDGLRTSISLYNQGMQYFPHEVNQSPVWPLALGAVGSIFGMQRSAEALPELLYLLDLVLLYALVRRLLARAGVDAALFGGRVGLDLAHVAVALFGLNHMFFRFTSSPYTEGLAFAVLFSTLLALDRAALRQSVAWAALAGALATIAMLTRAQLVGLVVAVPLALLMGSLRTPRLRRLAAVAAVASALAFLPWLLQLLTWMQEITPLALLGVGDVRETPELERFVPSVEPAGLLELLRDRARGLVVAFDPRDPNSYVSSFGPAVYLVPLALGRLALDRARWPDYWRGLTSATGVLAAAGLLMCGAALLPVHLTHSWIFKEWLFGHRHGLAYVLPLTGALVFLFARAGRPARAIAVLLVAASLFTGARNVANLLDVPFQAGLTRAELELVSWLDARIPRPVVVTTRPQTLAVYSRSGMHWTSCVMPASQTLQFLEYAGADFVVVYAAESGCSFIEALEGDLALVRTFGAGSERIALLRLRPGRG